MALVGFGLDSPDRGCYGRVVIWLFSGGRGPPKVVQRRGQQLIARYALLVLCIGVEAIRDLLGSGHPE